MAHLSCWSPPRVDSVVWKHALRSTIHDIHQCSLRRQKIVLVLIQSVCWTFSIRVVHIFSLKTTTNETPFCLSLLHSACVSYAKIGLSISAIAIAWWKNSDVTERWRNDWLERWNAALRPEKCSTASRFDTNYGPRERSQKHLNFPSGACPQTS